MNQKSSPKSSPKPPVNSQLDYQKLADQIKAWGVELGFQQIAIANIELAQAGKHLQDWLANQYQGTMDWMADHGDKRYRPDHLVAGTLRVISARMNYLTDDSDMIAVLKDDNKAYISRYALGRDYHKLIRKRLGILAKRIAAVAPEASLRACVDSAPVLEKPLAEKSGLGWIGKNTLLLNDKAGSWFFLGEIYTSLPLPIDQSNQADQCGRCQACLNVCPTNAFPKPYVLDARRCISYLTIEHKGVIPEEFRSAMGNRIFGCDDCQIVCPWNRFARHTQETDFTPRHNLGNEELITLFLWPEETFLANTEGTPIRRIGYENWLRNLAIGLGNAPTSEKIINTLKSRLDHPSEIVKEHVHWALSQQYLEIKPQIPKLKKTVS